MTLGSEDLGGNLKTSRGANTLIALNCVTPTSSLMPWQVANLLLLWCSPLVPVGYNTVAHLELNKVFRNGDNEQNKAPHRLGDLQCSSERVPCRFIIQFVFSVI